MLFKIYFLKFLRGSGGTSFKKFPQTYSPINPNLKHTARRASHRVRRQAYANLP